MAEGLAGTGPIWMPVRAVPSAAGGSFLLRPMAADAPVEEVLFGLHGRPPADHPAAAGLRSALIRDHAPTAPVLPPLLAIWHLTRCGSTLTARMLSCIDALQVMDEPGAVVDICGAFWALVPIADRLAALDAALRSLGQRVRPGARHLVVKQSLRSWRDQDLFAQIHPDMHRVLIIRDPLEILVSNLTGPPGWLKLRDAVWSPLLSGVALARQRELNDAEFIARCLGRAFTAMAAMVEADPAGWLILDYAELPGAVTTRLLPRLGITPTPDEAAAMADATRLQAWSRRGRRPFSDDRAQKQAAATPEMHDLCDRFLRAPWQRMAAVAHGGSGILNLDQAARQSAS
ncbi:MAG: aspartyl/asparaginyl beta-hydroxylase [Tistrella sp.]|uniref:Aspartyl/asparaginyl beta-hydroxylase n=1 Tax=Tistrella mobilis TaxID=171437 RepID=A0A3B9ILD5_9PROT|nr:aspartyl/asparaginyl beta-hydroxylase [Tistrella sp.]MAD38174.1 aspartyl/asparaginyl beta-hydroxylase [Tistrella sp.]MBA77128.1 aspartyl/asparaginyl beta-hydroxylase [Tistrella sp.]HAE48671.1 aspartyl/asparaginyl beta-hydroxylase [Tistrella mobilis]